LPAPVPGQNDAEPYGYEAKQQKSKEAVAHHDDSSANLSDGIAFFNFPVGNRVRLEGMLDAFNLFNSDAAFGFLSVDARASTFGVKTNFVQPRVGQVGVRFVF